MTYQKQESYLGIKINKNKHESQNISQEKIRRLQNSTS